MPPVALIAAAALVEVGIPMGVTIAAVNTIGAVALSIGVSAGLSALATVYTALAPAVIGTCS